MVEWLSSYTVTGRSAVRSGSIPDRTLTQGLKIIGEKLHNNPGAVFCAMGHIS